MNRLTQLIEEAHDREAEARGVDDEMWVAQSARKIALEDAQALMSPLLDALWEIYKLSGADTDGDQGPGALIAGFRHMGKDGLSGFAELVVESVRELRQDYSEALRETA